MRRPQSKRGRILHRLVRAAVLLSAAAAVAVLFVMTTGAIEVEQAIPTIIVLGIAAGLISSIRYFTVRLPLAMDPATIEAGNETWGRLRGLAGDIGFALLVGVVGWIAVWIVRALSLRPDQSSAGDGLALFIIDAAWSAGWLLSTIAVFLVWMPTAAFIGMRRARRRGATPSSGWRILAWALLGLDVIVLVMIADAVFVPKEHAGPLAWWQIVLSVLAGIVGLLLVLLALATVSWRWWPRRWRRSRKAPTAVVEHPTRSHESES
ncbi:hypothetical protein [Microbacterium binotii]|uniref:hypothetical protein n=1 Tax=Microbacterium binotii TaxID=462710 RepID=UPI001F42BA63|nr:hypothetical protein [Microbacterium binotii]UIN30747.1 hypothetical protein LXM64_00645 [Microbacterium binotii]